MKKEYTYVPKVKKRLKLSVVETPYMKKKRVKPKSREQILYERALEIKKYFMGHKSVNFIKMSERRTSTIYNMPEFKELIEISQYIRKSEIKNYLCYAGCVSALFLFILVLSIYVNSFIMFAILPIVWICWLIFKPKVFFNKVYNEIYLPICYKCANISDQSEKITFKIDKTIKDWNKKSVNKSVVTNRFSILSDLFKTVVQKMVVRNYVMVYSIKNGKMNVAKKLTTIFSGYSFDLTYSPDKIADNKYNADTYVEGNDKFNDLQLAIINRNTFYGTTNLYDEDVEKLRLYEPKKRLLNEDWQIYVNDESLFTEKQLREIQKKVLMINNEIGIFNAYISKTDIRMFLNVQMNKNGLKENIFQSQLRNPEALSFDGYYSIVKTLYTINCMHRLHKICYGEIEHATVMPENSKNTIKNNSVKKYRKNDFKKFKPENNKTNYVSPSKSVAYSKKGDTSVDIAVRVLITVLLSGLLLFGYYEILDNNYIPNTGKMVNQIYEDNNVSTIVDVEDIR